MNRYYHRAIPTYSLRFCRWSRKGYAALLSRLFSVSIGHLNKNVVDRLSLKEGKKLFCGNDPERSNKSKSKELIIKLLEKIGPSGQKITHTVWVSNTTDHEAKHNFYNYYKGGKHMFATLYF